MVSETFRGGIHPYDGKELSMQKPTLVLLPKGELVYPLLQHIGAPAIPVVAKGDKVLVGQQLAKSGGLISTCVVSSVSGTVKGIEPRLTVMGTKIDSIVVENDENYTTIDGFGAKRDFTKLSKEKIRTLIKEAGIVGMGGAGFPTHVKLAPKDENAIEYVLINGAECEPYLTSDYRMMIEETKRLITGLKIILQLFGKAEGIIAVEDNKPEAIEAIQRAAEGESRIRVQILKTKYPQGAERQLIYVMTGKKLNSSMLPADVGCIVNNVETVISICMAVEESIPLIRRIVTVTGDAICAPGNFDVRTGCNYSELLEAAGGFKEEPEKIISGGPLMGLAVYSLAIPVTKTSSALLAITKDEVSAMESGPCIRCGRCIAVCPSRLVPQKLAEYADHFDAEGFEKQNGMECYECGCCTYVCPAGRRLTQSFKQTRRSILDSRKKG